GMGGGCHVPTGITVGLPRQNAADADADRDQEGEGPQSKRRRGGRQQFVPRRTRPQFRHGCRVLRRSSHPPPHLRLLSPHFWSARPSSSPARPSTSEARFHVNNSAAADPTTARAPP